MLFGSTRGEGDGLKEMIDQHTDGGYSAQTIENDVALIHECLFFLEGWQIDGLTIF